MTFLKHNKYKKSKIENELIDQIILIGKDKNQYNENNTPITLLENTLFSNEIDFPTNLHEGNYKVKIHLIRFEKVLATKQDIIYVKKIGYKIGSLPSSKTSIMHVMSILIAITLWFCSFTEF